MNCFSDLLVEHKLPLITADQAAKLFRNMFSDSEKVKKYQFGHTKTTHKLIGAIAKQITINLKEELLLTPCYGLATQESSDKDLGLTETSLFDIPNINSGSTAQQMYHVCNEVRNSFIGQRNSIIQKTQTAQGDQKIFDIGCPCHLAQLRARKGARELL